MLAVRLNKAQFEYDIHSIIKAFYPAETVKVFEEGTKDFESDGDNPQITIVSERKKSGWNCPEQNMRRR